MPHKPDIMSVVTWLVRLLTGATFIVSGFVKAIDPWGTLYKLQDYMEAMHLPDFQNLLIVAAFALSAYEFVVGVFLVLGCFRRSTPIMAAVFMAVMLPLTFWIAVWNPVEDCGCFGDAIILSNWATFWKNIVLTAAVVYLLKFNCKASCIVRPSLQWLVMISSAGYILAISEGGYIYQPLIDFRPYPIGSEIIDNEDFSDDDSENLYFVYAKDGVEKRFSIDDELPDDDSGWEFVRREEEEKAGKTAEKNLRIWSADGEDDVTDEALTSEGKEIILLMPDLKNVSIATTWQINSLCTKAAQSDVKMIGVAAASKDEIENWIDLSLASYPVYTADDTQIKMVARGNPAVVYLEDGRIIWKSTLRALDTKDFLSPDAPQDLALYARDNRALLRNATGIYLALIAFLAILSVMRCIDGFNRQF